MKYSQITPNLYLGGQYGPQALETMHKRGITAVVNMRQHSIHKPDAYPWMKVLNLPTDDWTPPSMESLVKGSAFIKGEIAAGGKVYVHCKYGEGRGPVMALAYLLSTGMTLPDAYATVQKVRTFVRPNKAQRDRLEEFSSFLEREKGNLVPSKTKDSGE